MLFIDNFEKVKYNNCWIIKDWLIFSFYNIGYNGYLVSNRFDVIN